MYERPRLQPDTRSDGDRFPTSPSILPKFGALATRDTSGAIFNRELCDLRGLRRSVEPHRMLLIQVRKIGKLCSR